MLYLIHALDIPELSTNSKNVGASSEFPPNYNKTLDCPPFTAMSNVVQMTAKGNPMKDRHSTLQCVSEIHEEGRAKLEWLNKNKCIPILQVHQIGWMHYFLYKKSRGMKLEQIQ